ncbi:MAG: hypothetical protein QOF74_909, partial [Caballeronia mineralivorans]|nr:hypothetical protein [Caballeronia mineralivorans]
MTFKKQDALYIHVAQLRPVLRSQQVIDKTSPSAVAAH